MHLELLYRLLLTVALYGGTIERGVAPHYAEGVMEQVARNRDIAPASCMVSRPDGRLGAWVWVYGVNTHALRRCKVVDVSAPRDLARHIRTKRVVEIAFEDAKALCGSTREPVRSCPVMVIEL